MPSKDQHYKKSGKNVTFFKDVVKSHPDWAMTGLFYAALHLVDAFLATKSDPPGIHPEKHLFRTQLFTKVSELKPLYEHYRRLEDFGHKARYKVDAFTTVAAEKAYTTYFMPIRDEMEKLLNISSAKQ